MRCFLGQRCQRPGAGESVGRSWRWRPICLVDDLVAVVVGKLASQIRSRTLLGWCSLQQLSFPRGFGHLQIHFHLVDAHDQPVVMERANCAANEETLGDSGEMAPEDLVEGKHQD